MAQGHRPDRLGDQIRTETSDILAREVHDPGVGFVTITRVSVTADLQIARVFYTTMATGAARKDTARALLRATPFVRRQLAGRLGLRRMPELEFRFDYKAYVKGRAAGTNLPLQPGDTIVVPQ